MSLWEECVLAWGFKKLSNTDLPDRGSHQHEFNILNKNVAVFAPFFGQRTFARFHFIDSEARIHSERFVEVFCYDSRNNNPDRGPEYRLYYPRSVEPALAGFHAGDWLFFARDINQELHILLWQNAGPQMQELLSFLRAQSDVLFAKLDAPELLKQALDLQPRYKIYSLEDLEPLGFEQMGSKEKHWRRAGSFDFLWKRQRDNTGEAWVEKVCSELGRLIDLPVARVDLGCDERGAMGILSEAFVWPGVGHISHQKRKGRAFQAFQLSTLMPGNLILGRVFSDYDAGKQWSQTDHTLENIERGLLAFAVSETESLKILELFLFDCWIGNTDRHHENWGLIASEADGRTRYSLAPAFDHGTALAATRLPEAKRALLQNHRVTEFYRKGRSGVYKAGKVLPFPDLARACFELEYERRGGVSRCASFVRRIASLDERRIEEILDRLPGELLTTEDREFTLEYLRTSCRILEDVRSHFSHLEG